MVDSKCEGDSDLHSQPFRLNYLLLMFQKSERYYWANPTLEHSCETREKTLYTGKEKMKMNYVFLHVHTNFSVIIYLVIYSNTFCFPPNTTRPRSRPADSVAKM